MHTDHLSPTRWDEEASRIGRRLFGGGRTTGFAFGESADQPDIERILRERASSELQVFDAETRLQAARGQHGVLFIISGAAARRSLTAQQLASCFTNERGLPIPETPVGTTLSLFIAPAQVASFRTSLDELAARSWAPQTRVALIETARQRLTVWPLRKGERLVTVLIGEQPILGERPSS